VTFTAVPEAIQSASAGAARPNPLDAFSQSEFSLVIPDVDPPGIVGYATRRVTIPKVATKDASGNAVFVPGSGVQYAQVELLTGADPDASQTRQDLAAWAHNVAQGRNDTRTGDLQLLDGKGGSAAVVRLFDLRPTTLLDAFPRTDFRHHITLQPVAFTVQ
jgi:hypothetical protein